MRLSSGIIHGGPWGRDPVGAGRGGIDYLATGNSVTLPSSPGGLKTVIQILHMLDVFNPKSFSYIS